MNKQQQVLKDESGITLVELLAALSILSVVIILAGSIHMFGQRQFISQTESASQANDLSHALTAMSSDLRKQKAANVKVKGTNQIFIKADGDSEFRDEHLRYHYNKPTLTQNGGPLAKSLDSFTAIKDGDSITITLATNNQNAANKNYHTTIYFRGESGD